MQFFVLGTPRSGTSVVARLLTLMGAEFGPPHQSIGASSESPRGIWERRDVRRLNEKMMSLCGCSWDRVATFSRETLNATLSSEDQASAKAIIADFKHDRPSMLKDPQFCFLLDFWLSSAANPAAVLVYRHPVAVARSLQVQNQIPLHVGIALWEHYLVAALNQTRHTPRLLLSFDALAENPLEQMGLFLSGLGNLGETGFSAVRSESLNDYFDQNLIHHHCGPIEAIRYLGASQLDLHEAAVDGSILNLREELEVSEESVEVLAGFEAEREWLEFSLEAERESIKSRLGELQGKLDNFDKISRQLRRKRDEALIALSESKNEAAELRSETRIQGAELRSTAARLELQEDKLKIAAHWLEKASEHYAVLTKTRRWRFLSLAARFTKMLTGRESRFDASVREMKQLENNLRALLPSVGTAVKVLELESERTAQNSKRGAA
ncbi:MAG: sulfotransferase [Bdellovibrionales bacterium]|nr:sulfotransferase [Bdellovibrionales bacterium]